MELLQRALELKDVGRYSEALRTLDSLDSTENFRLQILRADLLEATGNHRQARTLIHKLLKGSRISMEQRAACEVIHSRIRLENGEVEEATQGFQRAMSLCTKTGDLKQLCWIQGKLVGLVAEQEGRDAAAPLLADLRRNITKLGDSQATIHAHLFIAEMEGRQGHLDAAKRHVQTAKNLLRGSPNTWLAAFAENVLLAVAVLESAVEEGRVHSSLALRLSDESGVAQARRSAAANTGNLLLLSADFDGAAAFFEKALSFIPASGERNNGILEALAQIQLAQNRLAECESLLSQIERAIRNDRDRTLYSHRHAELTRGRLLAKRGHLREALDKCHLCLELAAVSGDTLLHNAASIFQAELLQTLGSHSDCLSVLRRLISTSAFATAETLGKYHSIIALLLRAEGSEVGSQLSARAAKSIFAVIPGVPIGVNFEDSATNWSLVTPELCAKEGESESRFLAGSKNVLRLLSGALVQATRPEIAASAIAEALLVSGCATMVQVVECDSSGADRVLLRLGNDFDSRAEIQFEMTGVECSRRIRLAVKPLATTDAEATLNLITPFVERIRQVQQAHLDQERRSVLWPVEVMSTEGNEHIISGHMREIMTFAQRVARTNVNVLITGESGTGKEIVARAIHEFSHRANKPFVPFNCAAVPRDLLESQLFGHRRGAFTGAERDQLGLIRSAADGTLFLDEIGEMSPDLQPKLLRFLESGEIAPLGEPSPFTVNVRVLAATNANLDDAVRDGKFREDLFYRLNVVRLSLKPLRERRDEIPGMVSHFVAAASREFTKGRVEVSEDTMERLLLYRWPGNVRQLQNEIRRMVALAEPNATLEPRSISPAIIGAMPDLRQTGPSTREIAIPLGDKLLPTLSRIEYEMIKAALRQHQGKVHSAAKSLGISRKGLYLKRQRLGL